MNITELSNNIKRFLVADTTNIKDGLSEAELKEFQGYLNEAWEKAGKKFDKYFIAIVGNRSYECLSDEIKKYEVKQFWKQQNNN